jgi:NADH:ubiquinone oxidoreductase subunit 5 (subunit L)/multisubunit Na+/H+ antiporter MnhA subunit
VEKEGHVIHDPGWRMMLPIAALSLFSVIGGFLGPLINNYFGQTNYTYGIVVAELTSTPSIITFLALAAGGIPAFFLYVRRGAEPRKLASKPVLGSLHKFFTNRWYVDAAYYKILNGFTTFSIKLFRKGEISGLEGFNTKLPEFVIKFSGGVRQVDERVVDRTAGGIARGTVAASRSSSRMQTGRVSDYLSAFFFGLAILLVAVFIVIGVV